MTQQHYILTLSCKDTKGIVAQVSGFLYQQDAFIIESQQAGDASTGTFFMRTEFEISDGAHLSAAFRPIAERFGMQWKIHDMSIKPRVMIAVSKASHCLHHLLHRYANGKLNAEIPAIISNHPDLRHMAEWYNIPFHHLPITAATKPQQEAQLLNLLEETHADVLVLARYMQVLSPELSTTLSGRAINIHHSFLPGFKGANPYQQAYDRGVKIIGATAHYVTSELDEGPIIEQEVIRVDHSDTPDDLKHLGQDIESQVLFRALTYHLEHRVFLNGIKTVIFK